jgi:hypothetical protein
VVQAPDPPPVEVGLVPSPRLPNPEEHEPFSAGRSVIDVAAIEPVSEALPRAVTHNPTTRALALADRVRVYVVAGRVSTVSVVGTAVVAVPPPCGRELSTVKVAPLTAVTLPKAPNPPKALPPSPLPPSPLPPADGDRVGPPVAPGPRVPPGNGVLGPPRGEQVPFTAGEISTEAATIGPVVALGAGVGAVPPVPEGGRALRAWTHTPTTTSESRDATVLVKVVAAE